MRSVQERPYRSLLIGVGFVVLLSFLAAIGISKLYWGYLLRRPGLDRRLGEIERAISLTAVRSERRPDGTVGLVLDKPHRIYDYLSACRDESPSRSYYCLSGRVLVALADRGMLPAASDRLSPEELDPLYDRLVDTGKLVEGGAGYDHAKELQGVVLEAEGRDGGRTLFVAVSGRQVSNDHYPYYEFLFRVPDRGTAPRLLSHRRFYYDIAGMEGAEWPVAFVALLLLGILLLALVLVIRAAIATYRGRDALRTVTAVTVLVLAVSLTLTFGLGGCERLGSRPASVPPVSTALSTSRPVYSTQSPTPVATPTHTSRPTRTSPATRIASPTVAPTRTAATTHTPAPTHTPTHVSGPTRTAAPTATPEPTSTPPPMHRIESIPGSLVLYVQEGGPRSAPHRSLFERPELQHIYGEHVRLESLLMYLVGDSPIPSADGRYLVITGPYPPGPETPRPGTTWLGDLQTGELTALGPPALHATWSPDSHRMTYILDETLYVWDVASDDEPVPIFQREGLLYRYARWSPAGEWIAVASREGPEDQGSAVGIWAYWLVSPDGSVVRKLGTWLIGGYGTAPQDLDWSPDGKLLYTPSAVVITLDGQELRDDDLYENPPPSAPARYAARFVDEGKIPDQRWAWMSHDERRVAYWGHDGLCVFDRDSGTDTLIAANGLVDPLDRQWHLQVYWSMDDTTLIVGVHDAPRAGSREFWGQILAFKPEAGTQPELLAEGADLHLVGVLPDVLQVETPRATPAVEVPLEETPEATPTPRVPQPVPTRVVVQMPDLAFEGVSLTFDHPIAESVEGRIAPATVWDSHKVVPTHVLFVFDGYILPDAVHGARIEVFPVAEYEAIGWQRVETIAELRQLLVDRPPAPTSIPFLPGFDAGQVMRAQVRYIDFQGGSGVRFLTQYAHVPPEIDNRKLFYAFQGLTDEGNALISAILPVSHPMLPVHLGVFKDSLNWLTRHYDTYIAWVERQLNAQEASSFAPGLDQLDALIRALEVGPRCPSAVPQVTEDRKGPYQGWGKWVDEEYGFVLRYPPSWALRQEKGWMQLCQGDLRLSIAYRRQGEDFRAHWSGLPAGDIEERGTISVPEGEIVKRALVFENRLKALLYQAEIGDLVLSAMLDDAITLDYRAIELSEALQDQADQIVGSLEAQ